MLKCILLSLLAMIPLLFLVLFIVFSLGHLAPGDPVDVMYVNVALEKPGVTEAQKAVERALALGSLTPIPWGATLPRDTLRKRWHSTESQAWRIGVAAAGYCEHRSTSSEGRTWAPPTVPAGIALFLDVA